ncbi:putative exporter [Litorivivens lipolytica]|uniref:Putative exporter n=1 Tax=Litorivivens lipolytica TaxID=1524264 RepID=A0A7W4W7J2_9GAMM|nr:hypothetical protein [Litorivivens lipolytica]MBB3048892.1 putative exporter [Litorivivens lipolytica]
MEIAILIALAVVMFIAYQFAVFLNARKNMLGDVASILRDRGPMPAMAADQLVEVSRELIFDAMSKGDTAEDIADAILVALDPERFRQSGLADIFPHLDQWP